MAVAQSGANRWGGVGRRVKDRDLGHCVMGRDWGDVTCVKKVGYEDAPTRGEYKGNFVP